MPLEESHCTVLYCTVQSQRVPPSACLLLFDSCKDCVFVFKELAEVLLREPKPVCKVAGLSTCLEVAKFKPYPLFNKEQEKFNSILKLLQELNVLAIATLSSCNSYYKLNRYFIYKKNCNNSIWHVV